MATVARNFQFVNVPVAPRADRIPPDVWERHRTEAIKIYLSSNVEEVAIRMRLAHGFQASTRQYVYQFKKWGVRKQGLAPGATTTPLVCLQVTGPVPGELKRNRSATSTGTNSGCSLVTASSKPLAKKRDCEKSASLTAAHNKGVRHGNPTDMPIGALDQLGAGQKDKKSSPLVEDRGIAAAEATPDSPHSSDNTFTPMSISSVSSFSGHDPMPQGLTSTPSPNALKHNPAVSQHVEMRSPTSIGCPRKGAGQHTISCTRSVNVLSAQDVADIRRAADFFNMLHCHQEAFELYMLLLKYFRHSPKRKEPGLVSCSSWYLLIQCSATASTLEHAGSIRRIIEELLLTSSTPSGLEQTQRFLLHMLLAFICNRTGDTKGLAANLLGAEKYAPVNDSTLERVSPCDQALDLAVYLNLLRMRSRELCPLAHSTEPDRAVDLEHDSMEQYEDFLLRHARTPMWFRPTCGDAVVCIKSCLAWCHQTILALQLSPLPQCRLRSVYGEDAAPWNERDSLFVKLWQQWETNLHRDADTPSWTPEAQSSTGTSPTEMLMLVSHMIYDSSDCRHYHTDTYNDSISQLCKAAEWMVLHESDNNIARGFLKQYVSRNAVSLWPDLLKDTRFMDRMRIIEHLEEALGVEFLGISPEFPSPPESLTPSTPQQDGGEPQIEPQAPPLSQTLARSLSSIDLANFKSTGVSAARRVTLFTATSGSMSSFRSTEAARTEQTTPGRRDLSTLLKSMSISVGNFEET
ncbi:hypothetical protein QBC34DRAFT_75696 [Podospora aff. communis PSN243]|uniref:Clr5 domain-containing protein n=1 Tax=Podospora aff. communis PSN243 TaxID=3040156 RepID=A0AAV9GPV0_9PEZI|nr:hypothetical protein QBC34DRAFT_75696 [Podospora aff. communis PSN243]